MTIEQLQYFNAIYEHQTFSSAAMEMNISQSALSKQIAKLEQELGVCLFNRSHRQISLTKEGQELLKDTKTILKDYQKMMNHLENINKENKNTLKIAILPILSQSQLTYKLSQFSKENPDIHIHIDEIEERDFIHMFNHHDIYIIRDEHKTLSHLKKIHLYEDTFVAVISQKNPLSQYPILSIKQLKKEDILLLPAFTTITKLAIKACQEAGFTPNIKRYGRLETILSAASENEGIALVMKKSLDIFQLEQVSIVPFQEKLHSHINLYYSLNNQNKEVVKKFIHSLQDIKTKP